MIVALVFVAWWVIGTWSAISYFREEIDVDLLGCFIAFVFGGVMGPLGWLIFKCSWKVGAGPIVFKRSK